MLHIVQMAKTVGVANRTAHLVDRSTLRSERPPSLRAAAMTAHDVKQRHVEQSARGQRKSQSTRARPPQ